MKKTGYVHDLRYLLHDTGPYHPEMSDRLIVIHEGLRKAGLLEQLTIIPASRSDLKWILAVHDHAYVRRFEEVCLAGNRFFDDQDNQICVETFETAFLAVGGILDAVQMMMEKKIDNAFCAIRPPGHHAEVDKALGFCYFNNVAIAARYLQSEWGIERVGIVDFDVHHGNGTEHIFQSDPSVFYYSIHEHPSFAFPGTGRAFDEGTLKGFGFTKNSPVLPGRGDDNYKSLITRDLLPAFERFKPEVILVSTGFDAHVGDEMSDMNLTTEGFSWIMETIMALANHHAQGRVVSILEGGYSLKLLPELAANHVSILLKG
jgi:acetoin utilization deacetylase AcuC-like enzyme